MTTTRDYHIWSAGDVVETLKLWRRKYADLVRIGTSQRVYDLPRAGSFEDCPHDEGVEGCSNYYYTIQDYIAHPPGSMSSSRLPELMWIAGLHGDEPLGTTALMEATSLLLEAAACEAKPNQEKTAWGRQETNEAEACRAKLREIGISTEHRQWMARLVATRRIVVIPIGNPLGFSRAEQNEGLLDPDKDFLYSNPNHCMQTIAAKTIHEIFKDHIFQMVLSFHGGERGIGYSWSTERLAGTASPDEDAQNDLAMAFSAVIGGKAPYKVGQSNAIFQSRDGSLEDWAYAASWSGTTSNLCSSSNSGPLATDKPYNKNATNRAIAIRISTGPDTLESWNLGSALDIFDEGELSSEQNVAGLVRSLLYSASLVQPYVAVSGINDLTFSDDIVPLSSGNKESCQGVKAAAIKYKSDTATVEWIVGGAIEVTETDLWYGRLPDISDGDSDCTLPPSMMEDLHRGNIAGGHNGTRTLVHRTSTAQSATWSAEKTTLIGSVFRAEIDVSEFVLGERLVIIASAKVDQHWKQCANDENETCVGPQSSLVNARTNHSWHQSNAGKRVNGRLLWYSAPVSIHIGDFDVELGTIELSNRFNTGDVDLITNRPLQTIGPLLAIAAALLSCFVISLAANTILRRRESAAKARSIIEAETCGSRVYSEDYFSDSCHVQVCNESFVYDYDDNGDDNWEVIDFTT